MLVRLRLQVEEVSILGGGMPKAGPSFTEEVTITRQILQVLPLGLLVLANKN